MMELAAVLCGYVLNKQSTRKGVNDEKIMANQL